jgi:hypothetical protein
MRKKILALAVACAFNTQLLAETIITDNYDTASQMLLANEINESGEPFAEALGYNLDLLDPFIAGSPSATAYVLGIENYEYSRYQLGTIITRSGMGLHMMWAPLIKNMAAAMPDSFDGSMTATPNGFKEDDVLVKNIKQFSQITNQAPPGNPWPQFADFISGDPHLPQAIDPVNFSWTDFSTLLWDRSKMKKILNPAAMGQSLMKQYLWASDMLSAFHDGDDVAIDADGTNSPDFSDSPKFDPNNNIYFGGDSLDGFIGMVITAESINKVAFMINALAYDGTKLGAIDLASYNPANGIQYFPNKIRVTEAKVHPKLPPALSSLTVVDDSSELFDQASLLWSVSSFVNMMDPSDNSDPAHLAYHEVFDGSPFPAPMSVSGKPGPFNLMKGTAKAIFQNLMAMQFNKTHKTFVDEAKLKKSKVIQKPIISTVNAAYAIVSLEAFIEEFTTTPLGNMATKALTEQAMYMINHLGNSNGAYGDQVELGSKQKMVSRTVESQAAAVRGLFVAYRVTGMAKFRTAAEKAYHYLIANYYIATQNAFLTKIKNNEAKYTPQNFAVIAGALREASLEGKIANAVTIYTGFFQKVGNKMQLSEGAASGETGADSDADGIPFIPEQADGLPPIFASKVIFKLK